MNDIPDKFTRWTKPGCTFIVAPGVRCGSERCETFDGINGRRCADHRSEFEPEHAVALAADGWVDTALAYVRWSA